MGPGKAKDWDGSNVLGPCIVTADEFDATDARHARARQRRALGRGHERPHAPHLRRHDRLRLARPDAAPGRGARVGNGRRRLGPRARPLARRRATSSSSKSRASASCATPSDEREHDHGIRRLRQVAGQGGQGGAPAGGHPGDDAAVARGARQPSSTRRSARPRTRDLFFLYEQYVDEAGYQAHKDSEHFTRLVKEEAIPDLLEDRERAFYETIDDQAGGLA